MAEYSGSESDDADNGIWRMFYLPSVETYALFGVACHNGEIWDRNEFVTLP